MPAIGAVRQVALSAGRDLDATLAFWHDVLGMTVHVRFDPPGIAFIMAGDVRLLFTDGLPAGTVYLDISGLDDF
ncbi:MAG: glyoxalase, partial [Mesorhizobium sp.]